MFLSNRIDQTCACLQYQQSSENEVREDLYSLIQQYQVVARKSLLGEETTTERDKSLNK